MTVIEISGWVDEYGQLQFEMPANLPADEVRIRLEPISAEAIAADEAVWADLFARSQDELEKMAQEAHEDYLAGRAEDFGPDHDDLSSAVREPTTRG